MRNQFGLVVSCALVATGLSFSSRSATAQTRDSSQAIAAARTAVEQYQNSWLRAWVQSESNRHPVIGTFAREGDRKTQKDGSITFKTHVKGYYNDSSIFNSSRPESRHQMVTCRRLDEHFTFSDGRTTTVGEYAHTIKWSLQPMATKTLIASRYTAFSVCPSWYLGPDSAPRWDERISIDGAIEPGLLTNAKHARAAALVALRTAQDAAPSNAWVVGQLVRFHLDDHDLASATNVAQSCRAVVWWCGLLRSYVRNAAGDVTEAEQQYRDVLAHMPEGVRCRWANVAELLNGQLRETYEALPCVTRDSIERSLWWLTKPLWREASNERFAEHMTRRVLLELHAGLGRDERFDWRDSVGSDARKELVLRYGWPSYLHWRGLTEDTIRLAQLRAQPTTNGVPTPPNVPFVSYEYSRGRIHLLPVMSAIWEPYRARATDWDVASPPGGDTVLRFVLPGKMERNLEDAEATRRHRLNGHYVYTWETIILPQYVDSVFWWPSEHFATTHALVQLPEPQVALLRRETHDIIAVATDLNGGPTHAVGTRADSIALIVTPGPDSVRIASVANGVFGEPLVMQAGIAAKETMIGIETKPSTDGSATARVRFGVVPPAALSAMSLSDRAISEPILLRTPARGANIPIETSAALSTMATTTTVVRGSSIGLYWETYGFAPTDSVTIVIRVQRNTPENRARRLGIRLNLVADRNSPVAVSWMDAGGRAGNRMVIDGRVPVIGRTLTLDTSKLPKGDYFLDLTVGATRGESVWSRKTFVIR